MTATAWRLIIEMKMSQCLIIPIGAYWFESLEVQVIVILCGQQKEQCKVGMQPGIYMESPYQWDLHLNDHGKADTAICHSTMRV